MGVYWVGDCRSLQNPERLLSADSVEKLGY
jgi:hypothetical protein